MKLYDEIIQKTEWLLEAGENRELPLKESSWPTVSDRSMILRREMAYELGGDRLPALGCTLVTANPKLVSGDGIRLLGRDLPKIREDVPYARVALVRVREETLGEGQALYQAIRALEFTRYHFYPEGFMMRISSSRQRESVRVGREALARGLDFTEVGNQMRKAFHEKPSVEAVKLWYVTEKEFDFSRLEQYVREAEQITKTIDHMQKSVIMDCRACGLKEVCDEVEGLRELHFQEVKDPAAGSHPAR